MTLAHYVDTLSLLGDESRLRLCALLAERELCVTDLVRVTGISQPRVSTHLGRLREAGVITKDFTIDFVDCINEPAYLQLVTSVFFFSTRRSPFERVSKR